MANGGCKCKRQPHGRAIISNLAASVIRHETHEGRPHLVVPLVMAKAGVVMNGSLTVEEEFYPAAWNGRPVTVGHPSSDDGSFLSGSDGPQVVSEWVIGQLFNCTVEDSSLKGEAWIDVDKAEKVEPGIIDKLKKRSKVDVSTGYFCVDEEASGVSNGKEYSVISRNWLPDHLAILLNEEGACNWADGCGVRSNSNRRLRMKSKLNSAIGRVLASLGVKNEDAEKAKKEITELMTAEDDAEALVAQLIADEAFPFTTADTDALRMMSVDTLKALIGEEVAEEANADSEEEVAEEAINADGDEEVEPKACACGGKKEKAMSKNAASMSAKDIATLVANEVKKATASLISTDDRHALSTAAKLAANQRKDLVAKIVANTTMKTTDLTKMDLPTLELIANNTHPKADYGLRAVGNAEFDDEDKDMLSAMVAPTTKSVLAANKKGAN